MLFLKPSSALIGDGEVIEAGAVGRVDHEVELALIIGRTADGSAEPEALSFVSHLAVFNDVTARDMQRPGPEGGKPLVAGQGDGHLRPDVRAGADLRRWTTFTTSISS